MQLILNEYTNPSSILNCCNWYARIKVSPERQSQTYVGINVKFSTYTSIRHLYLPIDSCFNNFRNKYKKTVTGKLHTKFQNIAEYSLRGLLNNEYYNFCTLIVSSLQCK